MEYRNVTLKDKKVKEIYEQCFDSKSRLPYVMMLLLPKITPTTFWSVENKSIVGFVYFSVFDHLVYLIYLGVDSSVQNKGIGSQILRHLEKMYPNCKIVLSIEKDERRKHFYLKNGYEETKYFIEFKDGDQEILIKNGKFELQEFENYLKKYSHNKMKVKIKYED